ncbi:hypothetical protein BIV57_08135 [Mangrovactinospora gilvigrisea]|uniref:Uncharacterized protein n=1 Tax=Mangrovactinospora gilvigrisea TaxID=1428644 RepID=A0A1J7BH27_9ACTN|nr:hypothetical protein [Mangrovactinospora gilvigrisea]OIV37995.1 hypothetical protein BIV57_08135 [Mangrovactinospora gilvigrisea]
MDDETVILRDYTEAFKVKKAMRKLGRAHVPLKEGLFVDDIKVFGITLVLWLFLYAFVLKPPLRAALGLVGSAPPTGFVYIMLLLVPPIIAVGASRRPVRHNLQLFGFLRSLWRDLVDDPVHRRGVPVRRTRVPRAYRIVLWRARPDLLPALASTQPAPLGMHIPDSAASAFPDDDLDEDEEPDQEPDEAEQMPDMAPLSESELADDFVITTRRA